MLGTHLCLLGSPTTVTPRFLQGGRSYKRVSGKVLKAVKEFSADSLTPVIFLSTG